MENLNKVPKEVLNILESFDEMKNGYEECARMLKEIELLGWTFEFGLDSCPYDLREIK